MNFKRLPLRSNTLALIQKPGLGRSVLAALALTLGMVGAVQAQAYANVTVGGAFAPGVFGQISLGNNPPPPVYNVQPVIVGAPVYGVAPMYLHVSQEEHRDWGRHCGRYRACGHPVHFVRVEQNNRWWEHHGEYLRGQSYYRHPDQRRDDRRGEFRREYRKEYRQEFNSRWDNDHDPRHDNRRGER